MKISDYSIATHVVLVDALLAQLAGAKSQPGADVVKVIHAVRKLNHAFKPSTSTLAGLRQAYVESHLTHADSCQPLVDDFPADVIDAASVAAWGKSLPSP